MFMIHLVSCELSGFEMLSGIFFTGASFQLFLDYGLSFLGFLVGCFCIDP